jgi:GNAT superfamily N-acetyltransferase
VTVRVAGAEEGPLWSEISARGWSHDHPELGDFIRQLNAISSTREHSTYFLADFEGQTGAAGVLCIHDGVALFGGAATVPELRRRGLQGALLQARMRYAREHGCDLAMMGAEVGSDSQRNAERKGFQVAYSRIKWRLASA